MNESTILAILKASFDRVIGPRGLFQSTVLICKQIERTFKNGQGTMHIRDGSKLYTRATVGGKKGCQQTLRPRVIPEERQSDTCLNSKGDCSAVAPDKHPIISTNQPLVPLLHRILEGHPCLIPNVELDARFWVESSPVACPDAILPLRDQHPWERKGQGPQRDWDTSYLHCRTARGREIFENRWVRFKWVNPRDAALTVVPILDALRII